MTPGIAVEYIKHHLRLFGIDASAVKETGQAPPGIHVLVEPDSAQLPAARSFAMAGGVVVAIMSRPDFLQLLGVRSRDLSGETPVLLRLAGGPSVRWSRLRTLHGVRTYRCERAEEIVINQDGEAAWLWVPVSQGGVLLIGTDLPADLVRYRQGDPAMESHGAEGRTWGFDFERPLHLFERQLAGEPAHERHADWWVMALVETAAAKASLTPAPLLPGGAPGAIIITGDDDQAQLQKYDEQLELIAGTPVTYFLHPQTRHTPRTIKRVRRRAHADFGIHPDALDAPQQYGTLLHEQVEWFQRLVGESPVSLRNHGFLSSGYWRHLPHWLAEGIEISSNLPGLDGRVLNGSLLPARIVYEGSLTSHWSLLTAIGDGVIFIQDKRGERAADCVRGLVREVEYSRVPGIIVLNLHPQNVGESRSMHRAALEAISGGFHAWTMRECVEWFLSRDGASPPRAIAAATPAGAWERVIRWLR